MATEELKPPAGQEATFEVERLDWSSGRLEVTGRWFGIRGRRFIRPVLELEAGGRRHRLLATLEHKPWTAAEGEEWLAAFPWEGDPVDPTAAELAVGPDLTIELISPARDEDSDGDRAATGGSSRSGRRRAPTRPPEQVERELAEAWGQAERWREELDRARAVHAAEAEELRERLAAERGESGRRLDELRRERDAAVAAARDANRALDESLRARARLERQRDDAARAADRARRERDEWRSRAQAIAAERDAAQTERDTARGEGEIARAERDAALGQRDAPLTAPGRTGSPPARTGTSPETPAAADARAADAARALPQSPRPRRTVRIGGPEAGGPVGGRIGGTDAGESAGDAAALAFAPTRSRSALRVWAPRVAAILALIVLVAVVAGLVAWAT